MYRRSPERFDLLDADVVLYPDWAEESLADRWMGTLMDEIDWRAETLTMFGRPVEVPRLVAFHGEPGVSYRYSGVSHEARPWTPALHQIRELTQRTAGARFNSVLANLYRDGSDWMGWHSDDEPELGSEPVIASVSLGATRRFRLRRKDRRGRSDGIDLPGGSLLVMAGPTQHYWQHSLTRTRRPVGERINLTFRQIQPSGVADR